MPIVSIFLSDSGLNKIITETFLPFNLVGLSFKFWLKVLKNVLFLFYLKLKESSNPK